ncbi:MAG TPA: glycosyltransferase family 2 protein [Minicystis sp.]|nr:glycosyltransferase family 2 protein [Minicystis sp.]
MRQITVARRRRAIDLVGLAPLAGALLVVAWLLRVPRAPRDGVEAFLGATLLGVAVVHAAYAALQSVLWLRYRPFVAPAEAPKLAVTVVIPAFNEGPMVERSIRSVVASDYPRELLDVIVVDDGSRDDTFFCMNKLRRSHPDVVRLVRFRGNRGKRAALEAGFRAARGEIVVTIDSDSVVEPRTIAQMVAPFADAQVGAVAGRVAVLNVDAFYGRMLAVQYALAFDFARAAQSVYRAVAVCPGALSAFRREVILPHLDGWMRQTFLGRPVNHGEDQALTNIVLKLGYDTVYQRTAVIRTLAPTTHAQLARMLLRWDRSYVVEGLSFARFMLTRYREKNRVLPAVAFAAANLRVVLLAWAIATLPFAFRLDASLLLHGLAAAAVGALVTAAYDLRHERSFRFLYGALYAVYSAVLLQWVLPWAVVTVRDERWGTR